MSGTLHLYTDASVRGRLLSDGRRSRLGPGFGAWCAWHGDDTTKRPTLAGLAYLGHHHGTQTAEYAALVQGLGAAVAYGETRSVSTRPDQVRVYVDNRCVYLILIGEWKAGEVLDSISRRADALIARLHGLGMPMGVVKVSETNKLHKVVHSMSRQAPDQVLTKPAWRPTD